MTKKERDKLLNETGEMLGKALPEFGNIQFHYKRGKYEHFTLLETGKPEKKE